jgi:hypothetical protein
MVKAMKKKGKNDGDFAGKLQWIKSQFNGTPLPISVTKRGIVIKKGG